MTVSNCKSALLAPVSNFIKSVVILGFIASPSNLFAADNKSESTKPDIYFDLGNVIVDTSDWSQVDYVPNSKEYVTDLKSKGYKVKMLINFVDKLGERTFTSCEDKFSGLVSFLDSKWTGEESFNWSQFDLVMLPHSDAKRKPNPNMFVNALASSCPRPVLFQGDDDEELATAEFLGLGTWKVSLEENISLLEEDQISSRIEESFRYSYPNSCDYVPSKRCELTSEQMSEIVATVRNVTAPQLLIAPAKN